jgi:hypothetical protein
MHVKYRQDNLHRITWYIGTCGSNGYRLTICISFMIKCVCYTGLWINWFRDHGVTIFNGSVTIEQTSLVGVGHPRSDLVVPLILCIVYYVIAGVLTLYYRFFRTTSSLLNMDNISSRPYC